MTSDVNKSRKAGHSQYFPEKLGREMLGKGREREVAWLDTLEVGSDPSFSISQCKSHKMHLASMYASWHVENMSSVK